MVSQSINIVCVKPKIINFNVLQFIIKGVLHDIGVCTARHSLVFVEWEQLVKLSFVSFYVFKISIFIDAAFLAAQECEPGIEEVERAWRNEAAAFEKLRPLFDRLLTSTNKTKTT